MPFYEVWQRRAIFLGVLLCITVLLWAPFFFLFGNSKGVSRLLTVAFLDVGQGDAILVETPDGVQVLIDGGPDGAVLRALGKVLPLGDRVIDVVVGTHPDKDHVAGLVDVLARYQVTQVVRTENVNDTAPSAAFDRAVEAEGAVVTYARSGQEWWLGASTTLTILSPASDPSAWESNAASIVALLRYGDTEFLLTGDAPEGTETYLVSRYGEGLRSDVLKLGHHGSRTSSSLEFLTVVDPLYAVASAGKDNDYGHPHTEVVERVRESGAALLSTAEDGTVVFKSDGQRVWVEE